MCILHTIFFCLNKGTSSIGLQTGHLTALWRNTKQQIHPSGFVQGGGKGEVHNMEYHIRWSPGEKKKYSFEAAK
jgi:hypothetical protein